jgi:hypothetical protein
MSQGLGKVQSEILRRLVCDHDGTAWVRSLKLGMARAQGQTYKRRASSGRISDRANPVFDASFHRALATLEQRGLIYRTRRLVTVR